MAGTLSAIRTGIADRLATIPGLRVAEQIPEQINPPLAVITRQQVAYHGAFAGGSTEWTMQIQVIAGRMAEQQAQRQIDKWLSWSGPESVRAAIEADMTLGGVVHSCKVTGADALTSIQVGDAEYLGVTVNLTIYA